VFAATLIWPGQEPDFHFPAWFGHYGLGWHEFGCYVGIVPCVLFVWSLRRGWRWWHTLAVVCFWFAIGNVRWYHASSWLTELPVLSTLRVASRWRVIAVLGVAIGTGVMLSEWRSSARRGVRWLSAALAGLIVVDLGLNALPVYRRVFANEPAAINADTDRAEIVQTETLPLSVPSGAMLATLRANRGVVYSYEPLIGSDDNPYSARRWVGHANYRGEYWSPDGPVELVRWSPNKITLRARPRAEVFINQNPGSYWHVNGRRVFAELRSVDRHAEFRIEADANGLVELAARPRNMAWGAAATGLGILLSLLCYCVNRKLDAGQQQHEANAAGR